MKIAKHTWKVDILKSHFCQILYIYGRKMFQDLSPKKHHKSKTQQQQQALNLHIPGK